MCCQVILDYIVFHRSVASLPGATFLEKNTLSSSQCLTIANSPTLLGGTVLHHPLSTVGLVGSGLHTFCAGSHTYHEFISMVLLLCLQGTHNHWLPCSHTQPLALSLLNSTFYFQLLLLVHQHSSIFMLLSQNIQFLNSERFLRLLSQLCSQTHVICVLSKYSVAF